MQFDYGHMEEGQLSRPYNMRLLKRLIPYSRPYRKPIVLAMVLTISITLLELALPYLPKVAIDRYILSRWYPVERHVAERDLQDDFNRKYGHLVVETEKPGLGFISSENMKRIDPGDLRRYHQGGLVSKESFYRVSLEAARKYGLSGPEGLTKAQGSYLYVPSEALKGLSPDQIMALRHRDLMGLLLIGLFLVCLVGGSVILNYWEYYLLERSGQNMMLDIRMDLFGRIQRQAVRFFDRNPVGRLVTRATNDIENLNEMFKSVLITVFKDIFLLTGIIVVLVYLNWRLALISFTLVPVVFVTTLFFSTRAREVFREIRRHIAAINAFLQERLSGIRVIQLFVQERSQLKGFEELNHRNYLASMRQIKIFAIFMPFMDVFSAVGIGLLIWYGGGKVIGEQLSLGSLVAFIGYMQMFFKPIRDISEKYNVMQSAMASMERIFGLMDQRDVIQEPKTPKLPQGTKGSVQFKNVSFSYDTGFPVLKEVSFHIEPGQVVALVGHTGSGKTTTINLLERFYEFENGAILFEGLDIREWNISELRSRIGLVMQDVFIFAGSVAENISMGDERTDAKLLERVAKQVNAHRFIRRLPGGFDHEVKEQGISLSAGERQLLALSRAMAYDPTLLILDEATSSVDPDTERLIQDSILKLSKRQTTLIIAHRPSTIRTADKIVVMHHGRIVEQGTHQELMGLKNVYYRLNLLHEPEH
jgi:ATP-binding cassette subfamily B multidrug efflux pump